MIGGKNFIGSKQSAEGEVIYKTYNPKLDVENAWTFYKATSKEIDAAAKKAEDAFPAFQQKSGKERAVFLRAIATEIEALGNELIETYTTESGLLEGRAIGERGRTINQLKAFADLLDEGSWVKATIETAQPEREPLPKPDLRKIYKPLGPVAVFGASNFPFAFSTAGGDTASALAAGCPVVVKSHPMHAGTSELVAKAILTAAEKTNMPDGVFSHLNSKDIKVGAQLVRHPAIKAVGFTGSKKGGIALCQIAAEREEPIPVFAEMGSVNPVIILPGAAEKNADKWAKTYAGSINLGAGQFCTNPGLIFGIAGDELTSFSKLLSQYLLDQKSGCMLHPAIAENYNKGQRKFLEENGVETLALGFEAEGENYGKQALLKVSGTDFVNNKNLHQEVFGPMSLLVECESKTQLVEIIMNLEGQLTGTILAEDNEAHQYADLMHALSSRVGRIIFNNVPTGVEVCAAMQHGGPFPASSDSRFTSVGTHAIERWVRPLSFQDWPDDLLPPELQNANPLQILRAVNGSFSRDSIKS